MFNDLLFLIISVVFLWIGAGVSINGVEKLSKSLKISSFIISFFLLGLLTSLSELSVAYFSYVDKVPAMSVGNLIGASIVLTLLVIPLFAILNNGVKIDDRHGSINFDVAYFVVSLPALLIMDKKLDVADGILILCSLFIFSTTLSSKKSIVEKIEDAISHNGVNILKELVKIIAGIVLIFFSSKYIVDTSLVYSTKFGISTFFIGLLMLSIGTNLPELTILVKSFVKRRKNIALGDFVGSAIINTVIMVVLIFVNGKEIVIDNSLKYNVFLLPLGALLFLIFSRNRNLERKEGIIMIALYFLFIISELLPLKFLVI